MNSRTAFAVIALAALVFGGIAVTAVNYQNGMEARCKALGGVLVTGRNSNYCFKEAVVIPLK